MKQKLVITASVLMIALSAVQEVGAQWVPTNGPNTQSIHSLAQADSNLFVATDHGVFRSSDSGASWTAVNTGLDITAQEVYALAVQGTNLYAATYRSGIFLSTDQGESWTAKSNGLTSSYVSTVLVNGTRLFAGTDDGVFLSMDSGNNWKSINNGLPEPYSDTGSNDTAGFQIVLATNETNLFVGTGESIFLSSDSGSDWTAANSGLPDSIYTLALATSGDYIFASVARWLAGWNYGKVYMSSNDGINWKEADSGLNWYTVGAFAFEGHNLFAGTYYAGVYLSTNNGAAWSWVSPGLPDTSVNALFIFGDNIYAGVSGIVYRRPLSEMISTSAVSEKPSAQNSISAYPNPLSQSTTITFSSPESGVAEVTIVNLLGSEVKRIFSGELVAGEHSFSWDATGMAPGMYWCEIRMSGRIERVGMLVEK
jgi:ligand-binding sensor domain-containing protein